MSFRKSVGLWIAGETPRQKRTRYDRAQQRAYRAARAGQTPDAFIVRLDGSMVPVKSGTGSPLLDRFHGIDGDTRRLDASDQGLARAYAASVLAYRCIKVRAQTLASIPLELQTEQDEVLTQHPLARLFASSGNRLMYRTETDLQIWGKAFWVRGQRAVQRLNPQTIEVKKDASGITGFEQRIDGHLAGRWAPHEIVYFFDYDPDDDLGGLSPLSFALQGIRIKANIETFAETFFENGAWPAGMLTTEQRIPETDQKRLEDSWNRRHQGVENANKTALMFGGVTYEVITPPLKDLVMTELREEERRDIATAFGVPLTVALATDAANYATAKEQRQSFYTETVIPELTLLLDTINTQLVPRYGLQGVRMVADLDDIEALQEDRTEITQRNQQAVSAGYMSFNEAREREGLDPLPQDIFIVAGKPVLRAAIETGDLSAFEPPAPQASPFSFPFGGQSLPPQQPQRQLPEPRVIEALPTRSVVEVVVKAHDEERAEAIRSTVVNDTMLQDLDRWQRKVAKKGKLTPFTPDYLPDAVTAWLRADLAAWDGEADHDEWISGAFKRAASVVKAEDDTLATPEEFEAYWRGIDQHFDAIGATFEDIFTALPGMLASALRDAGRAGAEMDLSATLDEFQRRAVEALTGDGALTAVFNAGAARGNDLLVSGKSVKQGFDIDWQIVDQMSREWAQNYAADMVRGINATTLDIFQTKIAEWIEAGGSLEDLAKFIEGDLQGLDIPEGWSPGKVAWATSRERARLIAQTETTRAFHEGAMTRWEQAGVQQMKFRTQQDSLVCPICRPLNNTLTTLRGQWQHPGGDGDSAKYAGQAFGIPVHVGCRCFAAPAGVL